MASNVEPGSRVTTDGWVGYNGLASRGYDHQRRNQEAAARHGEDPGESLPPVHRVSSLCRRWLLGTHQGRVDPAHLQAYLNEFAFRFNPPLTQPRPGVLPRAGARHRARPGALSRHPRGQEATQRAAAPAGRRPPAQPGPSRRGPTLANR